MFNKYKDTLIRESLNNHLILRAKERYNLDLSQQDIGTITSQIQKNQGIQITYNFQQKNRRNVFKIKFNNMEIYPVYNENSQVIHTFLTKQMVDEDSLIY